MELFGDISGRSGLKNVEDLQILQKALSNSALKLRNPSHQT